VKLLLVFLAAHALAGSPVFSWIAVASTSLLFFVFLFFLLICSPPCP
jgi:hypothetical protein